MQDKIGKNNVYNYFEAIVFGLYLSNNLLQYTNVSIIVIRRIL